MLLFQAPCEAPYQASFEVTLQVPFEVTFQTSLEASYQAPFDAYLSTRSMLIFLHVRCPPLYMLKAFLSNLPPSYLSDTLPNTLPSHLSTQPDLCLPNTRLTTLLTPSKSIKLTRVTFT